MSRAELRRRIASLSEEIRHYPTPIARCDLHLPALIEERAELMQALGRLDEQGSCSPAATWTNDGGFNAA
jgi:chorismate mutase